MSHILVQGRIYNLAYSLRKADTSISLAQCINSQLMINACADKLSQNIVNYINFKCVDTLIPVLKVYTLCVTACLFLQFQLQMFDIICSTSWANRDKCCELPALVRKSYRTPTQPSSSLLIRAIIVFMPRLNYDGTRVIN